MSKIITTRFEYVCYDDATGNLNPGNNLPPTYPTVLDTYSSSSSASTSQSYASYSVNGAGATSVATPVGATIIFVAPTTNTTLVLISQTSVALTPGGTATSLLWPVGPGQIVTLPGALNSGALSVQACSTTYVVNATAFNLQLAWSL